ncbi:hypothetical protein C7H19_24690 [Aphanothece hegewaldii CCALA 016]|uniref:Uncharacterized protein n=2 Tax=Aphanothece TaxID=1121 RepID=A0A2T1LQJ3_9CHRO|nr:hypothetical protein C7H19_24690 [Aphanothece hegewaldii CCALA 016]
MPPPPEPPIDSQQWLEQLASYYKQLVDYHQQAAQTAARQLAHLEILLDGTIEPKNQILINSTNVSLEINQTMDSPAIGQLSSSMPVVAHQDLINPQFSSLSPPNTPTLGKKLDKTGQPSIPRINHDPQGSTEQGCPVLSMFNESKLTKEIGTLLATEKGHAVHIDYIVRKLYGIKDGDNLSSITDWVRMALKSGEVDNKWSSIPDSPECWTLNLQELTTLPSGETSEKTTLTTREVAQFLQTSPKVIIRNKNKYAEQFTEGKHYLVDEQNWYYWTPSGIDLLKSLLFLQANPPNQLLKRKSKTIEPQRLPPYNKLNLMESIKKLLEERMGEVFSIDEVCQILYGELPPSQYTRIRTQVGKYLSKGKLKGDWAAVPDQKSRYTYNLNKIIDDED